MNQNSLAATTFPHTARPDRVFAVLPSIVLLLLLAAFGGRYLGGIPGRPFPWYVHVHALMFTGWVVLVIAQATLIRSGAIETHRRLGLMGMALAVLMVAVGIYSAVQAARHGHNPARFSDALAFMAVTLGDISLFAVFMLAAWWARRRSYLHKRFVMLAMLGGFAWPIVTRLPMIIGSFPRAFGLLALLVMIVPLVSAVVHRRFDWPSVLGGIGILLSVPLRRLIGESQGWHDFARWVVA